MINIFYYVILVVFTIFSWGFVDANMPLPRITSLTSIFYAHTLYPTVWYSLTVALLFGWYMRILYQAKQGLISSRLVWSTILVTVFILFWAFPAFSNDVFNYIATAKVTFLYRENPYIIMPIEIPNEPMLTFLNAANKVALYGPVWIGLTFMPFYFGAGNLLLTLFTFKLFIVVWYLFLCYLIWVASGKKIWSLAFFALNPLVILSTLGDAHNDVVMMALALAGFLSLKNRRFGVGVALIVLSVLIKGATVSLLPVFFWCFYREWKSKKLVWQHIWYAASVAMYFIFFLSPLREEVYAWYFIWPLTFLALAEHQTILHAVSYGFSFGLMFRVVPFLYMHSWSGITPLVKKIVTVAPPFVSTLLYGKTHHR